jgi:hypothetical protein
MSSNKKYRWYVLAVFFAFMLLHQSDRLLIAPLTTPIMETFGINEAQMGAVEKQSKKTTTHSHHSTLLPNRMEMFVLN